MSALFLAVASSMVIYYRRLASEESLLILAYQEIPCEKKSIAKVLGLCVLLLYCFSMDILMCTMLLWNTVLVRLVRMPLLLAISSRDYGVFNVAYSSSITVLEIYSLKVLRYSSYSKE